MKGDIMGAVLLACAGRCHSYASIENKLGHKASGVVSYCLRKGYLVRDDKKQFYDHAFKLFKTTPRGAEWVFAYRKKKKKAEQYMERKK